MPPSLEEVQKRTNFRRLFLPSTVDSISWVADTITHLSLLRSDIPDLGQNLPRDLKVLDLKGASKLSTIPPSVQQLTAINLEGTDVTKLDNLSDQLTTLAIGSRYSPLIEIPQNLHSSLRNLILVHIASPQLSKLKSLKRLVLQGYKVQLSSVPRSTQQLLLHKTQHESLDGRPENLDSLEIIHPKNRRMVFSQLDLPSRLTSLTLSGFHAGPVLPERLPQNLNILRLPVGSFRLGSPVPEKLSRLFLQSEGVLELAADSPLITTLETLSARARRVSSLIDPSGNMPQLALHVSSLAEIEPYSNWLTHLYIHNPDLKTLEFGQSPLPELNTLDLGGMAGLNEVKGLPKTLVVLSLFETGLGRLPEQLPADLEVLDIRRTTISDLSPLKKLKKLRTVLLTTSHELDLAPLPPSLESLYLTEENTDGKDLWTYFADINDNLPYPLDIE